MAAPGRSGGHGGGTRAQSRLKSRPRALDDDLQLLAGDIHGNFADLSADVDVLEILSSVVNSPDVGIRSPADARFWSGQLNSRTMHTMIKDVYWWAYASLMDKRTRHRVLIPSSMTASMHKQMFKRISDAYVVLMLSILDKGTRGQQDARRAQFLALMPGVIRRMFVVKFRRTFVSIEDPMLDEISDLVSHLLTGSSSRTVAAMGAKAGVGTGTGRTLAAAGSSVAAGSSILSQPRPSSRPGSRQRHGAGGSGGVSGGPSMMSSKSGTAGIDGKELMGALNALMVETNPARKLPAVMADRPESVTEEDGEGAGEAAPLPPPDPLHLPPAVRMFNMEEDEARTGIVQGKRPGSGPARRRRGSGIEAALARATGTKKKVVRARESLPAGSKPKAAYKQTTLLYSPLVLSTLGGCAGGLSHASRHAVRLGLTSEQTESERQAAAASSMAAGLVWDPHKRHLVAAEELPLLPKPGPGTAAPPATPRALQGPSWCSDFSQGGTLGASSGGSAFMTEPPPDAPPSKPRETSEAVLKLLLQAKQAKREQDVVKVETVEDRLKQARARQKEIMTAYGQVRADTRADIVHSVLSNKRSLDLIKDVRNTVMGHSSGVTELSNHLTAMRTFEEKADEERRAARNRRLPGTTDDDEDIYDPDCSPMLPVNQGVRDRPIQRNRLSIQARKNVGENPARLRNMGIIPGSNMSTANSATKQLIVSLHSSSSAATLPGRQGGKPPKAPRMRPSASAPKLTTLRNGITIRGDVPPELDPDAFAAAALAAEMGTTVDLASGSVGVVPDGGSGAGAASGSGSGAGSGAGSGSGSSTGEDGAGGGDPPPSARSSRSRGRRRKAKKKEAAEETFKFPTPDGVRSRAEKALARQRQLLRVEPFEVTTRRTKPPQPMQVSVNDLMYIAELPRHLQARVPVS